MLQEIFSIPSELEIRSSRTFPYPAEKVFEAWSNPVLLAQWWGPTGFTNTIHEFDMRPGGRFKLTMHGPDKGHYENESIFHTIEKPRLIVWDRISKPLFRVVTTFEAVDDEHTLLIFRMQFATKEECDKIRGFAPEKNEENFDRLETVLSTMTGA